METKKPKIAYFSMEFALDSAIPNYAGGLGVLATDIVRSAADMEIDMIGVSLIYHQEDEPEKAFDLSKYFEKVDQSIEIDIEGRKVEVTAWKHDVKGQSGHIVPIYFLSTYLPTNEPWDRDLTRYLYSSNQYTRLCQEAILGAGGLKMLRVLGHDDIDVFHMNEGHASFLTLERLKEEKGDRQAVIDSCVFTTHTPIPAGHDRFPHELVKKTLGSLIPDNISKLASESEFHTTILALRMSRLVNGVSKKHAEVCKKMFPDHNFLGITNGVHLPSWASQETKAFLDQIAPDWQVAPRSIESVLDVPIESIAELRQKNKKTLVDYINAHPDYLVHAHELEADDYFDEETLTMTFSRRFVPYKRPLLLFNNLDRLREIGFKKIQLIFNGLCHPGDEFCSNIMKELLHLQSQLRGQIRLAVVPDRNLDNSKIFAAGSDVWLNNPEPPMEACGTSGMKSALNGGVNFSTLDGWWIEAAEMMPHAGWACGCDTAGHDAFDCDEIYSALSMICETYYNNRAKWLEMVRDSMSLAAQFNTHRNVQDYLDNMWMPCISEKT